MCSMLDLDFQEDISPKLSGATLRSGLAKE